ncbi:hypothetical protein Z945_1425 [Sulfitobacter noctilucae]|nr:hypothetical protein Z945_1425 [Sulfitobacter noctilucae]
MLGDRTGERNTNGIKSGANRISANCELSGLSTGKLGRCRYE